MAAQPTKSTPPEPQTRHLAGLALPPDLRRLRHARLRPAASGALCCKCCAAG